MISHRNRIAELSQAVLMDQASEEQILELESLMQDDQAARLEFLNWSALHVDLSALVSAEVSRHAVVRRLVDEQTLSARVAERRPPSLGQPLFGAAWRGQRAWWAALAAMLVVGTLTAYWLRLPQGLEVASQEQPTTNTAPSGGAKKFAPGGLVIDGMAVVSRTKSVLWSEDAQEKVPGDLLRSSDWIAIESGELEIVFGQGAVVVLEGPARFVAKSTSLGVLDYGKLAAVVPPWAEGFRINTSEFDVVDLGTQFVMELTRDRKVNIGVTKGEVEVLRENPTGRSGYSELKHRLLAGKEVLAMGNDVSEISLSDHWHEFSNKLPILPDHTQAKVMAKYRRDFIPGIPNQARREGNWRYIANQSKPVWESQGHVELRWDSRRRVYDSNGDDDLLGNEVFHAANFSYRGGHPGQGRDQVHVDLDHYVIAAYQVTEPGNYRLESGWLVRAESRDDLTNQAVDLRVSVNLGRDLLQESCNRDGLLQFAGDLGELKQGDWVYVAVGPQGVSFNDRFEWDFALVKVLERPIGI